MSEQTDDVIVRFTGDDYPHPLLLSVRKAGESVKSPLDLSLATSVRWAYKKTDNTVIVYTCDKDSDPSTGIIYIPFVATDVDIAGEFKYDVQVVWAANGKKQTIKKSTFMLNEDINKE